MLKHIPNLITLLRIVLAPVFVITYFYVSRTVGIVVLAAIMLSDLADGYIARRFHVQSKLGELLDPFADKLAQVVICIVLFLDNIAPLWFMVVLIVKEMLMLIFGYIFLKKDEEISSAKWYGKAATACFYISHLCQSRVQRLYVEPPDTSNLRLCICGDLRIFCLLQLRNQSPDRTKRETEAETIRP